jgi:hypothetical protein
MDAADGVKHACCHYLGQQRVGVYGSAVERHARRQVNANAVAVEAPLVLEHERHEGVARGLVAQEFFGGKLLCKRVRGRGCRQGGGGGWRWRGG